MSITTRRSGIIASALVLTLCLASALPAQQARVSPLIQPPQRQMLGVHTNFIQLGYQYFVPNRGLPQGQPAGQPAVAVAPPQGSWGWDGYISTGCRITSVTPGSVAAMAGLEVGDTVLSLNGQPMNNQNALANAVGYCQGQNVMCWVINVRDGQLTPVWCNFGGGWGAGPTPVPASPAITNR